MNNTAQEVAIQVNKLSKNFIIPHEQISSIKGFFTGIIKNKQIKSKEIQHALQDINFEIYKGEFFGIVGRNGSGKSTLLKILAGIYQPSKGTIKTNGKLVPFIELGVGFNQELTGKENIYLNGAMLGFSTKEIDDMYSDIVEFAELERFMDQKLKNYSSGMQVRLAFSIATRAKADILLIDEVLAVGDANFQRKCFNYFKELKIQKTTVVFVSHDMSAIREYCDRAMLIENSQIVNIGNTDNVAESYSRIFTQEYEPKSASIKRTEKERWGSAEAVTDEIKVFTNKNEVSIVQTIKVHNFIKSPVIGIRIRDGSGNSITGTNSKIEKKHCPDLKKGQVLKVNWQLPNFFSDGIYIIDPAIVEQDGLTVVDWWDDAARFTVQKERHIPYSIDPGFSISLEIIK